MSWKLATLTALERAARGARAVGFGFLVDRLAPIVGRPFEHFVLDAGGVRLSGTTLAQLHYVRELLDGRDRTFVRLLSDATPVGGTVLEGGAHLGFVTVHAARAVGPNGRVIAFEPNRSVHGVLRANLEANGVADRVELHAQALGAERGRARFHVSEDTSSLVRRAPGALEAEVDVVRGDAEVRGRVDVVKLDVEGSETAAIRGLGSILAGPEPPRTVFAECFPELLEVAGSSRDELVGVLVGYGYRVEWIDEVGGETAPLERPWSGDYANLVCTRP